MVHFKNSTTVITLFNLNPIKDENEVEVPAVKVSVSTEATPTVAPLGVTLRAAPVTTRYTHYVLRATL